MVCFPCETVVWHILPSIRRDICTYLIKERKMKTKDVAAMLGITDAAVSQYIHGKRANSFSFGTQHRSEIKALSERIAGDNPEMRKGDFLKGSCALCRKIRLTGALCDFRRKQGEPTGSCTHCITDSSEVTGGRTGGRNRGGMT
jgi:predicted transcriptional regulator